MLNIDQLKHDYHLIIRKDLIKILKNCEVISHADYDTINTGFSMERIYRGYTTEWRDNNRRILMIEGNVLYCSETYLLLPMYTWHNLKWEIFEELIKDTIQEIYKSSFDFNIKHVIQIS